MSHEVFLSYAREDQEAAAQIYQQLLEDGVAVWLDRSLRSGEFFPESINSALRGAGAIVCVWSDASIRSDWVRAEALVGFERKVLVPLRIGRCEIPVPFNGVHTLDLSNWDRGGDFPEWRALLERLADLLRRDALSAWALRGRPVDAAELARIARCYPDDALARKATAFARERLGVDISTLPLDEAPPQINRRPAAVVDERQTQSAYEAKRRHIERIDEQERCQQLEAIRGVLGSAHSVKDLVSDLTRMFSAWSVEVCFASTREKELYARLIAPSANAQGDALGDIHRALSEEFRERPHTQDFRQFVDDTADRIGSLQIELSCGGFFVYVEWDDPIPKCELYEEHWHELSSFDPPTFDGFVEAQGGAGDYYSGLSLLGAWVRDRFIEFCAVKGIEPAALERDDRLARRGIAPGDALSKPPVASSEGARGVLNYLKETGLAFILIFAIVMAFGLVAQWFGLE